MAGSWHLVWILKARMWGKAGISGPPVLPLGFLARAAVGQLTQLSSAIGPYHNMLPKVSEGTMD